MIDTIIIGGGIAGLIMAEYCIGKTDSVMLLEKYPNLGGRILTHRSDTIQYEIGAGRIHASHSRVHSLIKRFNLTTIPIPPDTMYHNDANPFQDLFEPIRKVLETIQPSELAKHTIAELVPPAMHPIFKMFPYYAEFRVLRADKALSLFRPNETMASAEYTVIKGGIDQLITNYVSVLAKTTVNLRTRHRVEDIRHLGELFEITGNYGKKKEAKPFVFQCKRVILATDFQSFPKFSILKNAPFMKYLESSPLIRIYAVYPVFPGEEKVWFHDIKKTVSDTKLRFCIPIDAKKGLIMISYTDGEDTNIWREKEGDELQALIQQEVKQLFPTKRIPEPTYLQKHDWKAGCTYWKKGNYDLEQTSLEAHNPIQNFYICGESINASQSWIESALESAEILQERFLSYA